MALLAMGGCAATDQAVGVSQTSQSVRLCSPLARAVVEARLTAAWRACYDKAQTSYMMPAGGILIPSGGGRPWQILRQTDRLGDVTLSFSMQYRADQLPRHLLSADLGSSPQCATTLMVRAYDDAYVRGVHLTEEWLKDSPDPATLNCK